MAVLYITELDLTFEYFEYHNGVHLGSLPKNELDNENDTKMYQ